MDSTPGLTPSWFRRVLSYTPGRPQATGYDVAVVARKLRVPVTVYGPVLEARVRGFQALRGLPTDGVVDLTVAKELGDVHLFVPEWYSEDMSEDSLRTAQMLLGIPANGVGDAITENAVRRFQSGRGIPVTGVIDIDTAKWMGEL